MKGCFALLIFILLLTGNCASAQNPTKEEVHSIQQVINAFKSRNKSKIADLVAYPLYRSYPVKEVKNKSDFIRRFDEILTNQAISIVANSKIRDWTRESNIDGFYLDYGSLHIDGYGKISSINYATPKGIKIQEQALKADQNALPKSLQGGGYSPTYLIFTKTYKIRIDEKSDGATTYRFAAWELSKQNGEPDILSENGDWQNEGTLGNHSILFKTDEKVYKVSIDVTAPDDYPNAILEISENENILFEVLP